VVLEKAGKQSLIYYVHVSWQGENLESSAQRRESQERAAVLVRLMDGARDWRGCSARICRAEHWKGSCTTVFRNLQRALSGWLHIGRVRLSTPRPEQLPGEGHCEELQVKLFRKTTRGHSYCVLAKVEGLCLHTRHIQQKIEKGVLQKWSQTIPRERLLLCTCIYTHIHIHMHMWTHMHIHAHTHTYTHLHTTHTHTYSHIHTPTHTWIHMHIYTNTRKHSSRILLICK
jgi:hypothetical protein